MWLAFTQAAVYNAVVGITGRYEPYSGTPMLHKEPPRRPQPRRRRSDALKFYFPDSEAKLEAAYDSSLAGVPDGRAERRGDPVRRESRRNA